MFLYPTYIKGFLRLLLQNCVLSLIIEAELDLDIFNGMITTSKTKWGLKQTHNTFK